MTHPYLALAVWCRFTVAQFAYEDKTAVVMSLLYTTQCDRGNRALGICTLRL